MHINWYGQSCFRLQSKSNGNETNVITDPYGPKYYPKLPKLTADIVTISHDHDDHNNIKSIKAPTGKKEPFLINGPGEYEINDVFIYGIPSWHDNTQGKDRGENIIYLIKIEGIAVCHLGDLGQTELTDEQLELMNNVDVLLVPVGGKYTIDTEQAVKIVTQIEPRIVIPMHYKIPGLKLDIDDAAKFIKAMGGTAEGLDKLKINKKDLPQEETELIILKS